MIKNKKLILSIESITNPLHICLTENIIYLIRNYVDYIYTPKPLDKRENDFLIHFFSTYTERKWDEFPTITSLKFKEQVIFLCISNNSNKWAKEEDFLKHTNITLISNIIPKNNAFEKNYLISNKLPDEIDERSFKSEIITEYIDSNNYIFIPPIVDQIGKLSIPQSHAKNQTNRILLLCDKKTQRSIPFTFVLKNNTHSLNIYDIETCIDHSKLAQLKQSILESNLIISAHTNPTLFHYTLQICNLFDICHKFWYSIPISPLRFVIEQNTSLAEYYLNSFQPYDSLRSQFDSILKDELSFVRKHEVKTPKSYSKNYFINCLENYDSNPSQSVFSNLIYRGEGALLNSKNESKEKKSNMLLNNWIVNPFARNALSNFEKQSLLDGISFEILNIIHAKVWETIIYSGIETRFLFEYKKRYISEKDATETIKNCLRLNTESKSLRSHLNASSFIRSIWCTDLLESLWDKSFASSSSELIEFSISVIENELNEEKRLKDELISWYFCLLPFSTQKDKLLTIWDSLESQMDDRSRGTMITFLLRNLFFTGNHFLLNKFLEKDFSLKKLNREDLLLFAIFSYLCGSSSRSCEAYALLCNKHPNVFLYPNICKNRNFWILQAYAYELNGQNSNSQRFYEMNTDQSHRTSRLLKLLKDSATIKQHDSFLIPSFDLKTKKI